MHNNNKITSKRSYCKANNVNKKKKKNVSNFIAGNKVEEIHLCNFLSENAIYR